MSGPCEGCYLLLPTSVARVQSLPTWKSRKLSAPSVQRKKYLSILESCTLLNQLTFTCWKWPLLVHNCLQHDQEVAHPVDRFTTMVWRGKDDNEYTPDGPNSWLTTRWQTYPWLPVGQQGIWHMGPSSTGLPDTSHIASQTSTCQCQKFARDQRLPRVMSFHMEMVTCFSIDNGVCIATVHMGTSLV